MMCPESFLELIPRKPSASRKHSHVVVPPRMCGTPELLCCKRRLVVVIVGVHRELGLYGLKPAVSLQRLVGLVKQRRLGPQELLVSRNRWLVVRLRPRRSALLHELTEECGLLVAPGEHAAMVLIFFFLLLEVVLLY